MTSTKKRKKKHISRFYKDPDEDIQNIVGFSVESMSVYTSSGNKDNDNPNRDMNRMKDCLQYMTQFEFPSDTTKMDALEYMESIAAKSYRVGNLYIEKAYELIRNNRYKGIAFDSLEEKSKFMLDEIKTLKRIFNSSLSLSTINLEVAEKQIKNTKKIESLAPISKVLEDLVCWTIVYCRAKDSTIKDICRVKIQKLNN